MRQIGLMENGLQYRDKFLSNCLVAKNQSHIDDTNHCLAQRPRPRSSHQLTIHPTCSFGIEIIGTLAQHYNNIVGSPPMQEISMPLLKHEEQQLSYRPSFGKLQEKTESSLLGKLANLDKKGNFTGAWTRVEQIAYFKFLVENRQVMEDAKMRKRCRVFKRMAANIGTRGTIQCKSHHQKMMITHRNDFRRLIAYGKDSYLSESVPQLMGKVKKEDALYASQNFFYRMYACGPCLRIVINEACIKNYL